MIKVFKDYNDIPRSLLSEQITQWKNDTPKTHHNFPINRSRIMDSLQHIYHGKCAYCENKVDTTVDLYRPPVYYPWLSMDWSNLLPACSECNHKKGALFPIQDENNRIKIAPLNRNEWIANSATLLSEAPLLLNPEIDEPAEHLSFFPDGRIFGLTERGTATINLLGLNRDLLLSKRLQIINHYALLIINQFTLVRDINPLLSSETNELVLDDAQNQSLLHLAFDAIFTELLNNTKADAEFALLHRTIVNQFDNFLLKNIEGINKKIASFAFRQFIQKADAQSKKDLLNSTIANAILPPLFKIEQLRIYGVKCFEDTIVPFKQNNTVLLGINGRGKTTVLQLLALGLTQSEQPPFYLSEWTSVMRNNNEPSGFDIVLRVAGKKVTLNFDIKNDKVSLKSAKKHAKLLGNLFFVSYGMGRNTEPDNNLLARLPQNMPFRNVATLFGINNLVLQNGALKDFMKEGNAFAQIKSIITKIFNKAEDIAHRVELLRYDTEKATFYFNTPTNNIDNEVPLAAMSSGFRTSFQWIIDLVIRAWQTGFDLSKPETIVGIVLIDEIDIHLHIKWQRTILTTLQNIFTNIQFIVTTHSPFVAQSMSNKNLVELYLDAPNNKVDARQISIEEGSSYEVVINRLFGEDGIFNAAIEESLNEFRRFKDDILRGEKLKNDPEFVTLTNKLQSKSTELNNAIAREMHQIDYLLTPKN